MVAAAAAMLLSSCCGECKKAEECTKECTEECCDSTKCAGCDSTCVDCNKAE